MEDDQRVGAVANPWGAPLLLRRAGPGEPRSGPRGTAHPARSLDGGRVLAGGLHAGERVEQLAAAGAVGDEAADVLEEPGHAADRLCGASGTQLRRYEHGDEQLWRYGALPGEPSTVDTWLQQDKDDGWFVALGAGSTTVVAWNSADGAEPDAGASVGWMSRTWSGMGATCWSTRSPTQIWDLADQHGVELSAPGNAVPGACAGAARVLHGDRCEYRDGHHAAVAGGPVPGARATPSSRR